MCWQVEYRCIRGMEKQKSLASIFASSTCDDIYLGHCIRQTIMKLGVCVCMYVLDSPRIHIKERRAVPHVAGRGKQYVHDDGVAPGVEREVSVG